MKENRWRAITKEGENGEERDIEGRANEGRANEGWADESGEGEKQEDVELNACQGKVRETNGGTY